MRSRQLILAAATGYTWAQMEPFIRSLRRSGYAGDVVLLVDHLSGEDRRQLLAHGITLRRVRPPLARVSTRPRGWIFNRRLRRLHRLYPAFCDLLPLSTRRRRLTKAWLGRAVHHIACSRYFHYLAILEARAADYDEIMLTDVRDVIFQANPFRVPLDAPQHFFLEDRSVTIRSQINNRMWIANPYGEEVVARLADRPVSCSGISFGTTAGLLEYLAAMTDEIAAHTFEIGGADGYDQGVHNYLVWSGRFPSARILENTAGPVLTLQQVPASAIRTDASGRLLGDGDAVVPVLHQYDRHEDHRDRLRALLT